MNDILQQIHDVECALTKLFSKATQFSEHLIRYTDNELRDMYDLNYFAYSYTPEAKEIAKAIEYQQSRGDNFIKFEGRTEPPSEAIQEFDLDTWRDLTMLQSRSTKDWTINRNLKIKNLHDDDIAADILKVEMDNYGEAYGSEFTVRKTQHWMGVATKNPDLNFYAAYLDGRVAGTLYTFRYHGLLNIDGLIVQPEFRKMYVATSLLAACIEAKGGRAFLHAEADDTPKELYANLGFKTVATTYCAQKIW